MTCHDTIPFSKTITIILVPFLVLIHLLFYWNKNLKLFFNLADRAVNNVFIQRLY